MTNAMWIFLLEAIGLAGVVALALYLDHRRRLKG